MQYSHDSELAKMQLIDWLEEEMESLDGTEPSNTHTTNYLIKVGPLLARYEIAKRKICAHQIVIAHPYTSTNTSLEIDNALTECYNIHQEFFRLFSPKDVVLETKTFPIYCEECHANNSFVDDRENASHVCTTCGIVQRYAVAHGKHALSHADQLIRAPASYTYDPIKYYRKCLNEVQGIHRGVFSRSLLTRLANDCQIRGITRSNIYPRDTFDSLKRLRLPMFYPCRWALAKRLNKTYFPVQLPHNLIERLVALFQGMITRFQHVVKKLGLQRRNLPSIPTFTHEALLHWNYRKLAMEFAPLKSHPRMLVQKLILKIIFILLNVPTIYATPTHNYNDEWVKNDPYYDYSFDPYTGINTATPTPKLLDRRRKLKKEYHLQCDLPIRGVVVNPPIK